MGSECECVYRFENLGLTAPHLQQASAEFCHRHSLTALNVWTGLGQRLSIDFDVDTPAMLTDAFGFFAALTAMDYGRMQGRVIGY